jgi:hypothetical protein
MSTTIQLYGADGVEVIDTDEAWLYFRSIFQVHISGPYFRSIFQVHISCLFDVIFCCFAVCCAMDVQEYIDTYDNGEDAPVA